MKYSQESSLETVYQEMLDSIYKAAKQKLICLLDQKWFFKGSVTSVSYTHLTLPTKLEV